MSGLELRNIVKRFGEVTVVKQLDLRIEEGELVRKVTMSFGIRPVRKK